MISILTIPTAVVWPVRIRTAFHIPTTTTLGVWGVWCGDRQPTIPGGERLAHFAAPCLHFEATAELDMGGSP